jgi:hypothetical protein
MTNRTVVIRRRSFSWQQKTKRKIQPIVKLKANSAGFINPVFIVLACTVFSGLLYIYLVNQTAVKGIEMRRVEKEISSQQKNNESLKIKEAELKSLYHIEDQSKQLNLVNSTVIKYIEENPSVAYSNTSKKNNN